MIWLKILRRFIKVLNSNASPAQIAAGIALGAVMGFLPFFSLMNLLVLAVIIFFNVNMAGAFMAAAFFGLVSYPLDAPAHKIGYFLLMNTEALTPLWVRLYNMPLVPFTRFNNTVVLGSLVVGIALIVPFFFIFRALIIKYRKDWRTKLENVKFFKLLGLTKIINWYNKFNG